MQMSDMQLGEALGRTENAFLEANYHSMSVAELSEALGRTACAVVKRIYHLGLNDDSEPLTPREEKAQRTEDVLLARCDRCIWVHRQGERWYCPFGSCVDGRL